MTPTSLPTLQSNSTVMPNQVMSPGGLVTQQHPNYMGGSNTARNISNSGIGGGGIPNPSAHSGNATQWQTDYGPVDTGMNAFNHFSNAAYDQGLSRLQPQIDQSNRALQSQLVARGLEPGTAAYNAAMSQQGRTNNDMLNSLNANAQQQGLAAQGQHFGQAMQNNQFGLGQAQQNYGMQFGYDQLANQRGIAQSQAAASMANAAAGRQASMYSADLRNQLGLAQLTEGGRQFNATDAFRNQQLDSSNVWNAANAFNQFNNTNTNNWLAQQQANQNWFGNAQSQTQMGPGAQFTPVGGTAQNMMGLGQAQADASNGFWGNVASGVGAYYGACDVTMKKNIVFDSTENGIDMFTFNYKDSKTRYRGPIAQLLLKSHPQAVFNRMGKWIVDFSKIPVDMEIVHV